MANDHGGTQRWFRNPTLLVPAVVAIVGALITGYFTLLGKPDDKPPVATIGPPVTVINPPPTNVPSGPESHITVAYQVFEQSLTGRAESTLSQTTFSASSQRKSMCR